MIFQELNNKIKLNNQVEVDLSDLQNSIEKGLSDKSNKNKEKEQEPMQQAPQPSLGGEPNAAPTPTI